MQHMEDPVGICPSLPVCTYVTCNTLSLTKSLSSFQTCLLPQKLNEKYNAMQRRQFTAIMLPVLDGASTTSTGFTVLAVERPAAGKTLFLLPPPCQHLINYSLDRGRCRCLCLANPVWKRDQEKGNGEGNHKEGLCSVVACIYKRWVKGRRLNNQISTVNPVCERKMQG